MSLLSLIMIIKNETARLPSFLSHHQPLFDQLVIVDTGSEDNSVQVARDFGAVVLQHQWQDDFAAARNTALAAASSRWLLVLDADERIDPGDFPRLRAFLEGAPQAVFIQPTINYFSGGNHLEWQPVSGRYPAMEKGQKGFFMARRAGLFPAGKDLHFSGRVHESILPAAENLGFEIRSLDLPIHHFGYVESEELNRRRRDRYRQLVTRKLQDSPEDWATLLEMASIHLEDGNPDEARRLLELLRHGPDQLPPVSRGRFLLARMNIETGDFHAARQLLDQATTGDPKQLFPWLEWIRLERGQGTWSAVADLLSQSEESFGADEPLLLREKLFLLVQTGQVVEAAEVAQILAKKCPQWQEIVKLAQRLQKMTKGRN